MIKLRMLIGAVILALPLHATLSSTDHYETRLLDSLQTFLSLDRDTALLQLENLIQSYPDSRTALLIYADLLAAMGGLSSVIDQKMAHLGRDVVEDIREQLNVRWQHWLHLEPLRQNQIPANRVQLGGRGQRTLYMDLPASRLYVFEQHTNGIQEITNFYASIGLAGYRKHRQGDQKTPVGIYRVTDYIPGRNLHERYGPGALPIDYPNDRDLLHQRTGYGIWLHGTEPGFVNRAPLASDGCISLANEDFMQLHQLIGSSGNVNVVIDPNPKWVDHKKHARYRAEVLSSIETSHHALTPKNTQLASLDEARVFVYPDEENLYLVEIPPNPSNASRIHIRQYWTVTDNNKWEIVADSKFSKNLKNETQVPNNQTPSF